MKSWLILFFVCSAVVFYSCSNSDDYVFNEVAATEYYSISKEVEEVYEKFSNGKLINRFENGNDDSWGYNSNHNIPQSIKVHSTVSAERLSTLKRSEKAEAFSKKLNEYFQIAGGEYASSLEAYVELNCACPEQKDSIGKVIKDIYTRMSSIEDECLEIQKEFIKSIGGKEQKPI